jgi:glycosidase
MTEAMVFWVRETDDVDGFRCDVAGYVPVDFWENARRELEAVKPVFMLAEWESRDLHAAAFVRSDVRSRVFAVLSLSDSQRSLTVDGDLHHAEWTDWASGEKLRLDRSSRIDVTRWGYRLFIAGAIG